MPKVSVIIPVHNRVELFKHTLKSVLNQTYQDFNIWVVDDDSTEDIQSALMDFPSKKVNYMRLLTNEGPSGARNAGILASTGELIAFCDSDDLWLPEKLEKQVDWLDQNTDSLWVICGHRYFDETGRQWEIATKGEGGNICKRLIMGNFLSTASVMVRREAFNETGLFEGWFGEDWKLWLKIAAISETGYIPHALVLIREHPARLCNRVELEQRIDDNLGIIKNVIAFAPERYLPYEKKAYWCIYMDGGRLAVKSRDMLTARKYFKKAIQIQPIFMKPYFLYLFTFWGYTVFTTLLRLKWKIRDFINKKYQDDQLDEEIQNAKQPR